MVSPVAANLSGSDVSASEIAASAPDQRIRHMFDSHYDFVWRSLRRLGVPNAHVDDAAQDVFVVASRKLAAIEPGRERAYLFGTATRVAADARRSQARRREDAGDPAEAFAHIAASDPAPDALVEQKRARALLDRAIDELAEDVRPVFVLFELEGLTMSEIAECLDLPAGTVASRLRRARDSFRSIVSALQQPPGGRHV
jgi:RNA polymerase sigma-70 factor (ECF subfamily)